MNDKLRNRVVQEGGWASMQDLLVSDNVMVQRAGIECLTNLSTCSKATERLSSPSGMHDLTFFLIFAESDDLSSRLAATGALAMITSDEEIAKNLCALSVRTVKSSAMIAQENKEKKDKVADTDADDGDDDKTYARSALDVLVSVMQDPQQDQGVMQRMQVLFANLNQYKLLPGTE